MERFFTRFYRLVPGLWPNLMYLFRPKLRIWSFPGGRKYPGISIDCNVIAGKLVNFDIIPTLLWLDNYNRSSVRVISNGSEWRFNSKLCMTLNAAHLIRRNVKIRSVDLVVKFRIMAAAGRCISDRRVMVCECVESGTCVREFNMRLCASPFGCGLKLGIVYWGHCDMFHSTHTVGPPDVARSPHFSRTLIHWSTLRFNLTLNLWY